MRPLAIKFFHLRLLLTIKQEKEGLCVSNLGHVRDSCGINRANQQTYNAQSFSQFSKSNFSPSITIYIPVDDPLATQLADYTVPIYYRLLSRTISKPLTLASFDARVGR